jgi:hypothetical protein
VIQATVVTQAASYLLPRMSKGYVAVSRVSAAIGSTAGGGVERALVCIDVDKGCSDAPGVQDAHVIRYRRRLDPAAVLAIIEAG